MPDKIISFYYYGPATSRQSYNGVTVGSKINYSWNAMYGTYSAPNVPGLSKSRLGPAAVWINNTSTSTAATNATRTVNEGYGVYLTYALPDTDQSGYVSAFTNKLYGSSAVYGTNNGGGTTGTNLAPNASITVSSEYPNANWSKAKLTDGITGQFGNGEWASNGEQTPWAQLSWSQSVVTSEIVLYGRPLENENIYAGTLTFSDGSSVSVDALPDNGGAKTVTFSERTITWVKFQVDDGEGPNNGMSEFQVFGKFTSTPPQTNTNVALNKPVYSDSQWSDLYKAQYVNDGNATTRWASASTGQIHWIYCDLGSAHNISEVKLKWESAYATTYVLYYDNGNGWIEFNRNSNNSSLSNTVSNLNLTARYVSISTYSAPYNHVSLWEFEVYGTELKSAYLSTDMEEHNVLNSIKAYPNPVTDMLTIESPSDSESVVSIFDMQGKKVFHKEFYGQIQISKADINSSGMHIIKLITESKTYFEKIIMK